MCVGFTHEFVLLIKLSFFLNASKCTAGQIDPHLKKPAKKTSNIPTSNICCKGWLIKWQVQLVSQSYLSLQGSHMNCSKTQLHLLTSSQWQSFDHANVMTVHEWLSYLITNFARVWRLISSHVPNCLSCKMQFNFLWQIIFALWWIWHQIDLRKTHNFDTNYFLSFL